MGSLARFIVVKLTVQILLVGEYFLITGRSSEYQSLICDTLTEGSQEKEDSEQTSVSTYEGVLFKTSTVLGSVDTLSLYLTRDGGRGEV